MKEATGELNMTVITVVAIAAIAAFFYALVWPAIKANVINSQKCASAICNCASTEKYCKCQYVGEDEKEHDVTCAMKTESKK